MEIILPISIPIAISMTKSWANKKNQPDSLPAILRVIYLNRGVSVKAVEKLKLNAFLFTTEDSEITEELKY